QNGDTSLANNLVAGNTITSLGNTAGVYTNRSFPVVTYNDIWSNLMLPSTTTNVGGDFSEVQIVGQNGNVSVDPKSAPAPLFSDVTVAAGTTTTVAVLLASRYAVNQAIEYDNDGVARTVTVVNTGTNVLTFTPALSSASVAFRVLADW